MYLEFCKYAVYSGKFTVHYANLLFILNTNSQTYFPTSIKFNDCFYHLYPHSRDVYNLRFYYTKGVFIHNIRNTCTLLLIYLLIIIDLNYFVTTFSTILAYCSIESTLILIYKPIQYWKNNVSGTTKCNIFNYKCCLKIVTGENSLCISRKCVQHERDRWPFKTFISYVFAIGWW